MKPKTMTAMLTLFLGVVAVAERADEAEEKEIRELIETLVFDHPKSSDAILLSPGISGNDDEAYRKEFMKCLDAFGELASFQEKAFPYLIEHLDDERPSIHFRSSIEHTVGDAWYSNLLFQLMGNFKSYGLQRMGAAGKMYGNPLWGGSPFAEEGGVSKWLQKNQELTYIEMQIECLTWLLEKEKEIGIPNPNSYFQNILPLEIRILELKEEAGSDVSIELERFRTAFERRDISIIPEGMLPAPIK